MHYWISPLKYLLYGVIFIKISIENDKEINERTNYQAINFIGSHSYKNCRSGYSIFVIANTFIHFDRNAITKSEFHIYNSSIQIN